jgi:hypothetical protein
MPQLRPVHSLTLLLVIAFAMPTALAAPNDHFVQHERYEISHTTEFVNPCTGEPATVTVEGQGHLMLVSDGAGGAHVNMVETGHGTAIDASGAQYVVGQTTVGIGNATLTQGSQVVIGETTLHFISTGAGENYLGHGVAHILTTPDGTVREFELISTECRGE